MKRTHWDSPRIITSGVSRTLHLGNRVIELKHGPHWQAALGKRPAGMAVRALSWLGAEKVSNALPLLRAKLTKTEWEVMSASRAALPSWMARAVGQESRMDETWFSISKQDKTEALELASDRSGRPAHLIEKDIWVVWAL